MRKYGIILGLFVMLFAALASAQTDNVVVYAPVNGAIYSGALPIMAVPGTHAPISYIQVYIDGKYAFTNHVPYINTSLALPSGTHRVAIQYKNSSGILVKAVINATVNSTIAVTAPSTLDYMQTGKPYSGQFTASGGSGSYTFSGDGFPAGLSLSPDGLLSGTPTQVGNFRYEVVAKDNY